MIVSPDASNWHLVVHHPLVLQVGPKIALCLSFMFVGLFVYAPTPIAYAMITSCSVIPCDFTLMAAVSTEVATMNSLAQLQVNVANVTCNSTE